MTAATITETLTMGDRVDRFLLDNPGFLTRCAEEARRFMTSTGAARVGMNALIERVRWDRSIELKTDDFKVNNSFEPYLARLIMLVHEDLTDCFVTRRATDADEWLAQRPENNDDPFALFGMPKQRGRR